MPRSAATSTMLLLFIAGYLLGCGPRPGVVEPATRHPCTLTAGSAASDTVTVAVGGSVDPTHAPVPRNEAERLLFGHLYETLIRVDCQGRVVRGLAESWSSSDEGRRWRFTLRSGAAFWDGAPVTAEDIKASWLVRRGERPAPWADSVAGSAIVESERVLAVSLDRAHEEVPRIFAHAGLAVARRASEPRSWPLGTGAYAVVMAAGSDIVAVPQWAVREDVLPVFRFVASGDDPRDLIDAGAGLLVTRDAALLEYAEAAETVQAFPLPWDVVYLLLAPSRVGTPSAFETAELARELTTGAARAESRVPEGPQWWEGVAACPVAWSAPLETRASSGRIVYRRGDRTAQGLAERLVALAAAGRLGGLVPALSTVERPSAAGLSDSEYAAAVAVGRDGAYVLRLEKHVLDPCLAITMLLRRIPWAVHSDLESVLVPLVETRAQAIVRWGSGTVMIDWDGMPYLAPVAR